MSAIEQAVITIAATLMVCQWAKWFRESRESDWRESKMVERLRRMTEELESGRPLRMTRITRHDTPDGPMHMRERGVFVDGEFIPDETTS